MVLWKKRVETLTSLFQELIMQYDVMLFVATSRDARRLLFVEHNDGCHWLAGISVTFCAMVVTNDIDWRRL